VHPDVRKMLLTARAYAEGGRALAIYTALLLDKRAATDDEDERKEAADEVALLTPIVKAFLTDNGWIATSPLHAGLRRPRLHPANGAWSSSCATRAST
jgi:alkylation response protein AidB-like acyl-CoA dehydrogenase